MLTNNQNYNCTITFQSGDTLSVFIRPVLKISPETSVAGFDSNGNILNIPGITINVATNPLISQRFPGASSGASQAEINKFGWIGSSDNINNPEHVVKI